MINLVRIRLISDRIRIEIVATIDRTAGIKSQKSIKSRFEYNLERILNRPRLNHISLAFLCESLIHSGTGKKKLYINFNAHKSY